MAVAPASLRTDKEAMSFGFKLLKLSSSTGTPSIINNGSVLPDIEETPLKLIKLFPPGCPLLVVMLRPATCPCSVCTKEAFGLDSMV